jgi:hypothetical protein
VIDDDLIRKKIHREVTLRYSALEVTRGLGKGCRKTNAPG